MESRFDQCKNCGSTELLPGTVLGDGDRGPRFVPDSAGAIKKVLFLTTIRLENRIAVCSKCSFVHGFLAANSRHKLLGES